MTDQYWARPDGNADAWLKRVGPMVKKVVIDVILTK